MSKKSKTKNLILRIDDEFFNKLKDISEKENTSISFIIRTVINDYMNYYYFKKQKK